MCNEQIADPDRVLSENSGVVNNGDLERIKQQLFATLDDKLVSEFSGRYLTQSKCELDLPEEHLGFQSLDVTEQLKQQPLIKLGGLRTLYFEASVADGVLYINGEQFTLSASREAFIALLCDTQALTAEDLSPWLEDSEVVEQLTAWVNAGYWYFDDID
jgi:50S ribosomal protein L16 3-hydroxylase